MQKLLAACMTFSSACSSVDTQVRHQRGVNAKWRVQTNVLSRGQTLTMEAGVSLQPGQPLTTDFGPERPDASLLLDYGVLDHERPAVRSWPACRACPVHICSWDSRSPETLGPSAQTPACCWTMESWTMNDQRCAAGLHANCALCTAAAGPAAHHRLWARAPRRQPAAGLWGP